MTAIKEIAKVTMRRGPHAWGMAWIGADGRLRMFKQTGRIVDALGLLMMAADARFLIGHCRYATHGNPAYNVNNHPHPADGGWYVHNGVLENFERVLWETGREPVSHCDSEVLGLLIEEGKGKLMERCADASDVAAGRPFVMLGLWKQGQLVAVRRGNPLSLGTTPAGYYLASLPDGLPGKVRDVENETVTEFTKKGAEYAAL
jgi:glucosamine 6-phosphate synthetase-like amidotransferase/phosphosugar isomerase protein